MPTAKSTKAKSSNSPPGKDSPESYQLKYKICVSGAAETTYFPAESLEKTKELGRLIAEQGMILVTGATTGEPYWAAKGAKESGGFVIGISPAATKLQHVKTYRLPTDYHDIIIYTGFGYSGRNLLLTRASDAVITVGGRIGTLSEFTDAFEDQKPQGVLLGAGGTTDMLQDILERAHRGPGKVVFESDPARLLSKVIEMIRKEEAGLS